MKKNIIKFVALSCAALFTFASCVEEYDNGAVDNATRVTLSPAVENFKADGKTDSGKANYTAAVLVNQGAVVSDLSWTASIAGKPSWVSVKEVDVTEDFKETFSGDEYKNSFKGITVTAQPNTEYKRSFTLNIEVEDGTVSTYSFTQLGDKADAAITELSAEAVEFMAAGGEQTLTFTTNMGDVYKYELTGENTSWISVAEPTEAGKVVLKAVENEDTKAGRAATLKITVGTAETSLATVEVPVTQLPRDNYYFMYGPSAKKLEIKDAVQLTKLEEGIYSTEFYFMNSEKNTVIFNLNSRNLEYPCYALAKDGKVVEMASDADLPAEGPEIDVDGMRTLTVNFKEKTWTWERIALKTSMPDSELAKYPTVDYVAKDGTVKTWMAVSLHWDGGPDIGPLKLGSGLVAGHKTGGYDNTGSDPLVTRITDYDTEENGGKVPEIMLNGQPLADTKGRLYSGYEAITGEPTGCLTYVDLHPFLTEEYVDAIGNTIPVGKVRVSNLKGKTDAEVEAAYPMVTAQM